MKKRQASQLLKYEKKAKYSGFNFIAGIDEAGRGPLAGPVVACAVILKEFKFKEEVFDSKLLSHQKRLDAYYEILDKSTAGLGIVDCSIIDKINIYQATQLAIYQAISNLSTQPDLVLVDGNLSLEQLLCPSVCIINGDRKSLSIAAASIVAKVIRDKIMCDYDKIFPQYGFAQHKGYGTQNHFIKIKKFGPCPIHRFSFYPVKSFRA